MNDFFAGQQLCHCTLLQRCGSGAYGEVWLAQDEVGARVAIKIVPNGGRYSEREIVGLRNYRDCDHPNLLRIRHIENTSDYLFYTMDAADDLNHGRGEYLPDTLANRLRKFKRLDGAEISEMLNGLLAGLEELHRRHLVHRDLKPDNILWVNGRPTLADAGLITQAGARSLVGTPGFLSPRLLSGKGSAEPADDYYALGKVIYCALTGNPVEKYPSIPRELTLSGNSDWNRLFRELCESPVSSAEAFRKKMLFQPEPSHKRAWIWSSISAFILLLAVIAIHFVLRPATNSADTVMPGNAPIQPTRLSSEIKTVSDVVEKKWSNSPSPVLAALRTAGLYDKEQLNALLDVPWYSESDFFSRLEKCEQNPRMMGFPRYRSDKKPSPLEKELMEICRDYQEAPMKDLKTRQFHWGTCQGEPLAVQRTMLAEDRIMQIAALDYLTFRKIDDILASGTLGADDKAQLTRWLQLKNTLFR